MKKKRLNVTFGISTLTKFLIIIGLIVYAISYLDYSNVPRISIFNVQVKDILKNLGMTGISAGLVSIVVEISSIKSVINDAILKVVSGEFPYEKFDTKRLDELHTQISVHRCTEDVSINSLNDSVYSLEQKLLNVSEDIYYEYNKANFVIEHDPQKKVFKKKAEFNYYIIDKYGKDPKVSFELYVIHPSDAISEQMLSDLFRIKKFEVKPDNGPKNDLTDKTHLYTHICSTEKKLHTMYKYKIIFEYKLTPNTGNKVTLEYEYEIPDYDILQSYKVNYPCRKIEHTFNIASVDRSEKWELAGDAYTAFSFPEAGEDEGSVVKQSVPNSMRVQFENWSLPGAGYVVAFLKK